MITKRLFAAVAAAALVVLGSATGAFAAYEAPSISLEVSPTNLTGGLSFSGTASSNQDCDWEVTFDGPTTDGAKTGNGSSLDFTFSTTEVEAVETGTVTAVCTYDDGSPRASAAQQLTRSVDVTVNPTGIAGPIDGGGDGGGFGGLADTGGPHLWLAIGGAALTLVGAGAVIRSRRTA